MEKEINESLKKTYSLMDFQPGMTRTENKEQLDEAVWKNGQRVYKHIDRFVRGVYRNAKEMDKDYRKLANATYQGKNALEAAKELYLQKYDEELPMWRDYIQPQQQQPVAEPTEPVKTEPVTPPEVPLTKPEKKAPVNPMSTKTTEVAEQGATNMAIGFALNEGISQKERVRQNKEHRKKIKLGITS